MSEKDNRICSLFSESCTLLDDNSSIFQKFIRRKFSIHKSISCNGVNIIQSLLTLFRFWNYKLLMIFYLAEIFFFLRYQVSSETKWFIFLRVREWKRWFKIKFMVSYCWSVDFHQPKEFIHYFSWTYQWRWLYPSLEFISRI